MSTLFIPSRDSWWEHKKILFQNANNTADIAFGRGWWRQGSQWDIFNCIATSFDELVEQVNDDEQDKRTYAIAVLYQADDLFARSLSEVVNLFAPPATTTTKQPKLPQQFIVKYTQPFIEFGFSQSSVTKALTYLYTLESDKQKELVDRVIAISRSLHPLVYLFFCVGSALLVYRPKNEFISFEEFRISVEAQEDISHIDWVQALRFLGQSFFDRDGDTFEWTIDILLSIRDKATIYRNDQILFLFLIVSLHTVWGSFADIEFHDKVDIIKYWGWTAILVGISLQPHLEHYLADQPYLDFYLGSCFSFYTAYQQNKEYIFSEDADKDVETVSLFFSDYSASAGKNYLDGFMQISFIQDMIKNHHAPSEFQTHLQTLLNIYLHLREGNIVDYHGMIEEKYPERAQFHWNSVFAHDITPKELADIKTYFELLHRPFMLRVNIISALSKIHWSDDPILSRALSVSEIYENVYGPDFGPLIIFSEADGVLKLNATPPSVLAE